MVGLNKKIICFADEFGTPGDKNFGFGLVFIWARDCANADKMFTNMLPSRANEVHANKLKNRILQDLMVKYRRYVPNTALFLNKVGETHSGERDEIYAKVLIESVKTGLVKFGKLNSLSKIGNVHLIIDHSEIGTSNLCKKILLEAQNRDGRFKAVKHMANVDSSACRMLQVADVVAYSRNWVNSELCNAQQLHDNYGIILI